MLKAINISPFFKKIIKGTLLLTLGTVFSRGLLILASIVLVRLLSVSEYGEYGMIKSTIDNFLIFASMGVGLTTTKYISEYKNNDTAKASSILGASTLLVIFLSLIIFILISLNSDYIAVHILKKESLKQPLIIGSLILIFVSVNSTQLGALLGFQNYKSTALANICQGILVFIGLCLGAYYFGVNGAFIGNLIAMIILTIVIQILLKKSGKKYNIRFSLNNFKENAKLISKFAIPASLSTIIVAPTIWVLNTILVKQPNGYISLGLYSAVIVFSTGIQMLNGSLSNVLLPILLSKDNEITPKKEFFNYFGAWYITIFLALPIIIFPEIVSFTLGDKYNLVDVIPVLGLSILSTLIIANRQGISRDLIIKNKMWFSVFSMGQWAVTTFVLFSFFKDEGAYGFALSYALSYVLNYLIFIPFFIAKKISPKYIFYNKWVVVIWILLICLVFNYAWLTNFGLRIFIDVCLVSLLILSMYKFYLRCIEK